MEALAVIGLVSNVLGFIDTGSKLYELIKEYSSVSGALAELIAVSKRLELILSMIKELDESGKTKLDYEKLVLKLCSDEADELVAFLEGLKIKNDGPPSGSRTSRWLSGKRNSVDKGWKAFKTLKGKEKLEKFQVDLSRLMDLISMQQQTRVEYVWSPIF